MNKQCKVILENLESEGKIRIANYNFPEQVISNVKLCDFLENEVDEKYYISPEKCEKLIKQVKESQIIGEDSTHKKCIPCITPDRINKRQNGRRFKEDGDPSFTLTAQDRHGILKILVKEATKKGWKEANIGDSINMEQPASTTRRGRVGKQVAQTLTTSCNQATITANYIIRKLTPLECWRLMGFEDEDYHKAKQNLINTFYNGKDRTNSKMYKQAGNSIVIPVLEGIFKELLLK